MKTLKTLLICSTLLAVVATGCSVTTEDPTTAPEATEAPVAAPEPTEAPAPPVQAPVDTAPADNPVLASDCQNIDVSATSALIPTDWDEWCLGVLVGAGIYDSLPAGEAQGLCEEFWATTDDDILAIFQSPEGGSNSRDASIGIIDSLWILCAAELV